MEYPVGLHTRKLDDRLCAGTLALSEHRFCAENGASHCLLLCALCGDEHIRGSTQRQVEQKTHDAGLRPVCSIYDCRGIRADKSRGSCPLASVCDKRHQRPDEHRSAACERGRRDTADTEEILSENRRAAFVFAVDEHDTYPGFRDDDVCIRRHIGSHYR